MEDKGGIMSLSEYKKLEIQHEYSTFATMREVNSLGIDEDWDYCMNILYCIPNIDIEFAKKELKNLMGWDEENGYFAGNDWDYIMLDEILLKYIEQAGGNLYLYY